jgi:hypothetical protein
MVVRFNGAWLSLVERSVRDREVVGSNPIAPTFPIQKTQGKSFKAKAGTLSSTFAF